MTLGERILHSITRVPRAYDGEEFLEQPRALRTTLYPRTYGGSLFVSDRRVHFSPDRLNRLVGGRSWNAKWNQIRDIELAVNPRLLASSVTPELRILMNNGEVETFMGVADYDRIVDLMKRLQKR